MAHHNTVFAQMLKFIPTCLSRQGHEFESLANQHHAAQNDALDSVLPEAGRLWPWLPLSCPVATAFGMGSATSRLKPESSTTWA